MTIKLLLLLLTGVLFASSDAISQSFLKDTVDCKIIEKLIVQKLDSIRVKKKLSKYILNDTIYLAAKGHADYMVKTGSFSHSETNVKMKTAGLRLEKAGIVKSLYGENIAYVSISSYQIDSSLPSYDYKSLSSDIIELWVKSKPHYQNICNPQFKLGAVAVSYNPKSGKVYAVHNFTSKQ